MMATIRASCDDCGDVELTTSDVTIRVCTKDNQGTYTFACPLCTMRVAKPAEPRTVDLLVAAGVQYSTWSPPLELAEPHNGEPISHDNLLDFHDALQHDEACAEELNSYFDAEEMAEIVNTVRRAALRTSVVDLGLPKKLQRILRNEGIHTLDDLVQYRMSDLLGIDGFDHKSLKQVCNMLCKRGLALKEDCYG